MSKNPKFEKNQFLEILEQDEEIENQFTEAVNDVSIKCVILLAHFDYF
jgi:hypothetical protein